MHVETKMKIVDNISVSCFWSAFSTTYASHNVTHGKHKVLGGHWTLAFSAAKFSSPATPAKLLDVCYAHDASNQMYCHPHRRSQRCSTCTLLCFGWFFPYVSKLPNATTYRREMRLRNVILKILHARWQRFYWHDLLIIYNIWRLITKDSYATVMNWIKADVGSSIYRRIFCVPHLWSTAGDN